MRSASRCCSRCSAAHSAWGPPARSGCATAARWSRRPPSGAAARDPAPVGRDRARGAVGPRRRPHPRPGAPRDGQQRLRASPGGVLPGAPGTGRRAVGARRRRGRLSARDRGRDRQGARRMTRTARLSLFAVSAAGLTALLLWSVAGLPDFGHYRGPYGKVLNRVATPERHVTNVVSAVVFDYRGVDTLGEEFILFSAAMGVALLLRHQREDEERRPDDGIHGDALRLTGIGLGIALLVLGFYVIAHGYITPGGGFQGGVVLAASFALVYLAGEYRAYRAMAPTPAVDFVKGTGAGGYAVIGVVSLLLGTAYLQNFGPLGTAGTLASGGSIALLNLASALEVSAAFVLLFTEFLEELEVTRVRGAK